MLALASVAQLVGAGSIPSQGTCLGCRFSLRSAHVQEATDQFLSLVNVSLHLSLSPSFVLG